LLPVATRRQAFRRPHSRPAHIATASLSATIACDPATPPRLPPQPPSVSGTSLSLFSSSLPAGCTPPESVLCRWLHPQLAPLNTPPHHSPPPLHSPLPLTLRSTSLSAPVTLCLLSALLHSPLRHSLLCRWLHPQLAPLNTLPLHSPLPLTLHSTSLSTPVTLYSASLSTAPSTDHPTLL
jgi:hypothetical protein